MAFSYAEIEDSKNFLFNAFRKYYKSSSISQIQEIEKREFGIGEFGKKITQRHLYFRSLKDFNSFLQQEVPFFVSHSVAYYDFPERRPMQAKNYLGADLVYEFDADDIKTDCKKEHDSWKCPNCKSEGKGAVENCTQCGAKVEVEQWVCPVCLEETKKQSIRLIEFLQDDFGFSPYSISVNFSGFKGFHVWLKSNEIKQLSQNARIELLDYLTANSLSLEGIGFGKQGKMLLCPKPEELKGWNKRIMEKIIDLFEQGDAENLSLFSSISFKKAQEVIKQKQKAMDGFKKGILIPLTPKSNEFWQSMLSSVLEHLKLDIDRQTSADIVKILRVPDSIHGSTGLKAKSVSIEKLNGFKALDETIIFSTNAQKVFVGSCPKFYLKGETFGPFKEQEVELPEFAAVFLLSRGSAVIRNA